MTALRLFSAAAAVVSAVAISSLPAPASAAPFAFVPNQADDTVTVVDLATLTVVTTIAVGRGPRGVAIDADGGMVYVGNHDGGPGAALGTVARIAIATRTVLDHTPACAPRSLALSPTGDRLFMTSSCWTRDDRSFLDVIDTATMTRAFRVELGSRSARQRDLVLGPGGDTLYVAAEPVSVAGDGLLVVDLASRSAVGVIVTGDGANGIAATRDRSRLYVANEDSDDVAVVDPVAAAVLATIPVGDAPRRLAIDPGGSYVYVANSGSHDVSVIDTASNLVVATIPVGTTPVGIAVGPVGQRVYVTSYDDDVLTVVDTATRSVIGNVLVGHHPLALGDFVTPAGAIAADPRFHDFGTLDVGSASGDTRVAVSNEGDSPLEIDGVYLRGTDLADFEIAGDLCSGRTLATSGTCFVDLRFVPSDHGTRAAELSIQSDAVGAPDYRVGLRGTGRAPDIRVSGLVDPIESPLLELGTALVGSTTAHTRTVINDGNAPLSIGTLGGADALDAPFAMGADDCSGTVVAAGESCTFTLLFSPTTGGSVSDSFDLPSDDPDEGDPTIGVRGRGSAEPVGRLVVGDGDEPMDDATTGFGEVAVGSDLTLTFVLFNLGSEGALRVDDLSFSGADASAFSVDPGDGSGDTCGPTPITVPGPPDPSKPLHLQPTPCELRVTFAPGEGRSFLAAFDVSSDDPDRSVYTVELDGTGLAGRVDVPAELDLGTLPVGTGRVGAVPITNLGTADLSVRAIDVTGSVFTLDPAGGELGCGEPPVALAAGASCTVGLEVEITAVGAHTGTLTVQSDDPARGSVTVALVAEGVEDALPDGGLPDGGAPGDGGAGGSSGSGEDGGGCSCRTHSTADTKGWAALLLAATLALLRRRRRHLRTG